MLNTEPFDRLSDAFLRETMTQERVILVPRTDRGPWENGTGDEKGVRRIIHLFIEQHEWRTFARAPVALWTSAVGE
jgi:hypothetical protein